jgi:uridylate kinase
MAPVRRILLKLSGEALMGPDSFGYHAETMAGFVGQIREVVARAYRSASSSAAATCFAAPPARCPG